MVDQRARALRKTMTPPEVALWMHLRALRAHGFHFRRQSPESPYILDFVCRRSKLVVEVDGIHHSTEAQTKHDQVRDAELRKRGFTVLRFWASDVENELEGVMQAVLNQLGEPNPTRRAARDTLPEAGRDKSGRYIQLTRLGLRRRD